MNKSEVFIAQTTHSMLFNATQTYENNTIIQLYEIQ
jgi:hypothetical protein